MKPQRIEAARAGKRYFRDGKCKRCAETLYYVSTGKCVSCTRATTKAHYYKAQAVLEAARKSHE